jgi:hypothetical protein
LALEAAYDPQQCQPNRQRSEGREGNPFERLKLHLVKELVFAKPVE